MFYINLFLEEVGALKRAFGLVLAIKWPFFCVLLCRRVRLSHLFP